jgi:hypothetical protein
MRNKFLLFCVIAAFFTMASCQSLPTVPEEHKGAATGAGVGAVAGAILGVTMGDGAKSAVIGGLIGALVGGAIGHYYHDQKRTATETAKTYSYDPSKGPMLKIEDASVSPQTVSAGGTVNLQMTYALLTPSESTQIELTEKRDIRHDGSLVGNPEIHITRKAGTYTANVPLMLPADAKKGLYIVTYTVKSNQASDELQSSFTVR